MAARPSLKVGTDEDAEGISFEMDEGMVVPECANNPPASA